MSSFHRVCPVLPVRRVDTALAHYRKLGFVGEAYPDAKEVSSEEGPIYGFIRRGAVELHLARVGEVDPTTNMSACYLYVDDADALFQEWEAAGAEGRFVAPVDTPYGLRELAHVDPDGNLLRVGSELRRP
ncbi:MAG: VOC family protein [Polyangiaceae bacterium]